MKSLQHKESLNDADSLKGCGRFARRGQRKRPYMHIDTCKHKYTNTHTHKKPKKFALPVPRVGFRGRADVNAAVIGVHQVARGVIPLEGMGVGVRGTQAGGARVRQWTPGIGSSGGEKVREC